MSISACVRRSPGTHSPRTRPRSQISAYGQRSWATLEAKGYIETPENPDCRVSYVFSSQGASKKSGPRIGVGVGRGIGSIGVDMPIGRKKQSGTITIDVIDAARSAQIWSGSLDVTFKSAALTEAEVTSG